MTADTPTGRTLPVVTLFESYGSGAAYVGPKVAEALGLPFHQQAFSSEEIEAGETRRENEGLISRVFGALGTSYGGVDVGDVTAAQRDSYELTMENTRIVLDEAAQGGVIVGRNGAFILTDRPGALHVRLDGPLQQRLERAARDSGIDLARAEKRQKREDQVRAVMSIDLYGWDPRKDEYYDLVINTGRLDLDTAVEIIVAASRVRAQQPQGRGAPPQG
ncbi:AAA family ATPase [Georgenia yuyongxinii]|nr:cytidylate kinase-like family protein [Georgenia yuyongxinii]